LEYRQAKPISSILLGHKAILGDEPFFLPATRQRPPRISLV